MSVAAFNKFALLDDEDGKGSLGLATAKSKATAASPAEPQKTQQQSKTGPASRSGRYYARGGGPKPQATDSNTAAAAEESTLPTQRFDRTEGRHDRGRGRGEFRGRGEGRGRGRGGRPYRDDRHSKTGIVDTSKQVSQGWGGTDGNNELAVESAAEKDAQEETKAEGGASWGEETPAASWGGEGAPPGDAAAAPEGEKAAAPEPEEDNTMTLDEYLAKKAETGLSGLVGSAQIRKANEGAGDDLFKDAQQLLREEEEVDDFYVGKPKTQRAPKAKEVKEKITIEIDGQFADSGSRGGRGRGRGGRGDFRGGRGRGGDRDRGDRPDRGGRGGGYRGRNAGPRALNVDDQKAFPSLV
ncbi:hypothetical protein M407DRAFT_245812 [Tulasnella calospora MUT 4182]|uniref:Hyaluronan/mRNA-binding protein domain-containing protein n=1 Tax=Tulasnella calospora MUT 4182 TaxID=1051891 RepID=A0A0C3LG54_9AGAM|nr:hypothetical protein M407DRAFT_245812 [Tulasnella calospora MUT 4182]